MYIGLFVLHVSADRFDGSCWIAPGDGAIPDPVVMQQLAGTCCGLNGADPPDGALNHISYGFFPWFCITPWLSVNGNTPQHCNCSANNQSLTYRRPLVLTFFWTASQASVTLLSLWYVRIELTISVCILSSTWICINDVGYWISMATKSGLILPPIGKCIQECRQRAW